MIIQVDDEGAQVIETLCDTAVRAGGLKAVNGITNILRSITRIPAPDKTEETPVQLKKTLTRHSSQEEPA